MRRVGVVLSGAPNDKDTLVAAVQMAARERVPLRVALSQGCTREMLEKHLDFALWDVRERLKLLAPEIQVEEAGSWICASRKSSGVPSQATSTSA